MDHPPGATTSQHLLSAQDLLAGGSLVYDITVPADLLVPGAQEAEAVTAGVVRIRPLSVAMLTLISRAAQSDASLIPLLMVKEALVEPRLTLDQIRALHVGLVHFLVSRVNLCSGLSADGAALDEVASSTIGQSHILLAYHFGWTPEQVSRLTPGQVAVYLAGIEQLRRVEDQRRGNQEHR